jgi:hypothetical protein
MLQEAASTCLYLPAGSDFIALPALRRQRFALASADARRIQPKKYSSMLRRSTRSGARAFHGGVCYRRDRRKCHDQDHGCSIPMLRRHINRIPDACPPIRETLHRDVDDQAPVPTYP